MGDILKTMRDIDRDVPLDGRAVATAKGTWTVYVERVSEPAQDNSWRRFYLRLDGPTPFRLTLVVADETLVVEHRAGDPSWILDALRAWIMQPDVERGDELWLTRPPEIT